MKQLSILTLVFLTVACESYAGIETYFEPKQEYHSEMSPEAVGLYKHHPGEINKGTVLIEQDMISINTSALDLDLDLNEYKDNLDINPNCWIIIVLKDGRKIKISYFPSTRSISVWILQKGQQEAFYGDPGYMGTFDMEIPQQVNQNGSQGAPTIN